MPLNEDDLAAFNKCRNAKVALELVQGWQIHPHELCAELHRARPNIDATLLGECLGHHSPFWKECAAHFACHFDELAGKDIVAALRIYLFHFRLPGESGPIERILEGFAKGYMHFNPRQGVTSPEKIQPSGAASSSSASAASSSSLETFLESTTGPVAPKSTKRFVYASSVGWFRRQPWTQVGKSRKRCCVGCGRMEAKDRHLELCRGCNLISFCDDCSRLASRHGHAIGCRIGYGRGCVAAAAEQGLLKDGRISYMSVFGHEEREVVDDHCYEWPRLSPIKSVDAALVLSYAIVMLSTNIHNASVKPSEKMALHQFSMQLAGQNEGDSYPCDYLAEIYEAVRAEELKVRT